MMVGAGIFATYAPLYADCGIATFPVDGTKKKPLVEHPQLFGIRASRDLSADPKFAHKGVGMWCGHRPRLTVVDIDEPGKEALHQMLQLTGHTPLQVRTASGKHHLYFRWSGEQRSICGVVNGIRIDVLGSGGFVVVPPSERNGGTYEFISGGFDELKHRSALPTINPEAIGLFTRRGETAPRKESQPQACEQAALPPDSDVGIRNDMLFAFSRSAAVTVDTRTDLLALACARNAQFRPPLSEDEVQRTVSSVWRYKQQGRLMVPGCEATAIITRSMADALCGDSLARSLLIDFQLSHGAEPGKIFAAATAPLAKLYHVRPRRITTTLNRLIAENLLMCHHKGGRRRHDASLYSLTPKSSRITSIAGARAASEAARDTSSDSEKPYTGERKKREGM